MKIRNSWDNTMEEVRPIVSKYSNNDNLAIQLMCDEGPYATLTVNLHKLPSDDLAFVDVNNLPNAIEFIKENNLGKSMDTFTQSGYCMYPLYRFNLEALTTKG